MEDGVKTLSSFSFCHLQSSISWRGEARRRRLHPRCFISRPTRAAFDVRDVGLFDEADQIVPGGIEIESAVFHFVNGFRLRPAADHDAIHGAHHAGAVRAALAVDEYRQIVRVRDAFKNPMTSSSSACHAFVSKFPLGPFHRRAFQFAVGLALLQILALVELLLALADASATFTLPFFQ
jgi:hypothetical protein